MRDKNHTEKLDKQAILLLAIHASFGFATLLSGTFVPVYLWKSSQSLLAIGIYALFQYSIAGCIFYVAGKWVKEGNKLNCLRVGCLLSGVFYSLVLWLKENASQIPYLLGFVSGLGLGLFWLAYNIVYFEITEPTTRDRFNGWQGLLAAFSGMVAPWSSGIIISKLSQEHGYQIIFTASLIIFCCCAGLSFFIKKRKVNGQYDWLHPVKLFKERDKKWRFAFFAVFTQGVREGVFMFLIGLIVYMATNEESKVGLFTLLTSLVSFGSFWAVGKWIKPHLRKWSMLIGAVMLAIVILPLFLGIKFHTLIYFGIGTALFLPLYMIPITSSVFDLIGASEQSVQKREEFIVFRELALTSGRLSGLVPFFIYVLWINSETGLIWTLLLVGSAPIVGWFAMKSLFNKQYSR